MAIVSFFMPHQSVICHFFLTWPGYPIIARTQFATGARRPFPGRNDRYQEAAQLLHCRLDGVYFQEITNAAF
jgi:hypothetical protein